MPNLIEAAARNRAKGYADTALFEVGPAFANPKAAGGQKLVACGVRAGLKQGRHWSGAESGRNVDAFDAKADALSVIAACGAPTESIQVSRDAPAWYHPGRSGSLRMGANVLAVFGELHPSALETMDAKAPMAGFEVFLDNLPQARKKSGTAKALLKLAALQPVSRDFAFLVDRKIEADVLVKAVRGVDKELIVAVDVFDVFEGKGVPEGKKSVALTVTFQPKEQTLTEVDLEALAKKIVDAVAAKTGGVLRS